jgi:hypothetical protein
VSGVVLTLVANAYLERRRGQDARELESLRLETEHAKWLRDERAGPREATGRSIGGARVTG